MAVKSQVYDHPAYQAVLPMPTAAITGASGFGTKFAAWTALTIKSVTLAATVAGTSAEVINVVKISGTATTTTVYGTTGSGGLSFNFTPAVATNQVSCIQGDVFYAIKGADATANYGCTLETVVVPLSGLTV